MFYKNDKEEWENRKRPNAQIEKNVETGKFTVCLYHQIAHMHGNTITKAGLYLSDGLYKSSVGSWVSPTEFNTEQEAMKAFEDYRRRNPLEAQPDKTEVIKTLFE